MSWPQLWQPKLAQSQVEGPCYQLCSIVHHTDRGVLYWKVSLTSRGENSEHEPLRREFDELLMSQLHKRIDLVGCTFEILNRERVD